MAVTAAAAAATIAFSGFWAEFALFAASAVYLASARRWKVSAAAYILMALMMAMSVGCAMVLAHFFPAMARGLDMKSLSIPFLRGLTMMNVILPLAFSTRIQSVLWALQSMRLPFCIYLPAAVMLRFIPTFANDIRQGLGIGPDPRLEAGSRGVRDSSVLRDAASSFPRFSSGPLKRPMNSVSRLK